MLTTYNTEKYAIFCLTIPTHGNYSHCVFLPHGTRASATGGYFPVELHRDYSESAHILTNRVLFLRRTTAAGPAFIFTDYSYVLLPPRTALPSNSRVCGCSSACTWTAGPECTRRRSATRASQRPCPPFTSCSHCQAGPVCCSFMAPRTALRQLTARGRCTLSYAPRRWRLCRASRTLGRLVRPEVWCGGEVRRTARRDDFVGQEKADFAITTAISVVLSLHRTV